MDDRRKTYRPWNPHDGRQRAYVPAEVLPEDDLVFFLMEAITQMDLTPFWDYFDCIRSENAVSPNPRWVNANIERNGWFPPCFPGSAMLPRILRGIRKLASVPAPE